MVTVRDVPANKLIARLKEELKKCQTIKPPAWVRYVKTGVHRERPPEQPDFWYIRCASLLRRVYLDGPVGVQRLRTWYGGRRRRGVKPARFRRAGGAALRRMLQQLEAAGWMKKSQRGRELTVQGRRLLDSLAYEVSRSG